MEDVSGKMEDVFNLLYYLYIHIMMLRNRSIKSILIKVAISFTVGGLINFAVMTVLSMYKIRNNIKADDAGFILLYASLFYLMMGLIDKKENRRKPV